ncbi:hypothetical protein Bbelb_178550 [Branchiostoma belcheri]|nr:hypothetical protein Bbelb_178550 [Branchiostoma belcheri]
MASAAFRQCFHHDSAGFLWCEGVRVKPLQEDLSRRLPRPSCSPFYLYSLAQVRHNVSRYKEALETLPNPHILGYSLKANGNLEILKELRGMGCGAVTVSGNEIRLALAAGFKPDSIVYNGNGKQDWELELAVRVNCLINVDSDFDLRHVRSAAETVRQRARVLIRINPDIDPKVHPYNSTGLASSKFGLECSQLPGLLQQVRRCPEQLQLVGLHCHLGSTITDVTLFRDVVSVVSAEMASVRSQGFNDLQYLNMGGGLGINYLRQEDSNNPSPADLVSSIRDALTDKNICLILEPGRSIIGDSAILVTKVIGVKSNGEKRFVVTDGSMTEVIRPSLYSAYHHIQLTEPSQAEEPTDQVCDIVGPVCECGDFLGKDRTIPTPHEGCGLAVFDVGAYCSSMASNYNMRIRPAEVLVDRSTWRVIRRPETLDDMTRGYTGLTQDSFTIHD